MITKQKKSSDADKTVTTFHLRLPFGRNCAVEYRFAQNEKNEDELTDGALSRNSTKSVVLSCCCCCCFSSFCSYNFPIDAFLPFYLLCMLCVCVHIYMIALAVC